MTLFQAGDFTLASGAAAKWKIECDVLTPADWEGLATIAAEILPPFSAVSGVPRGGLPFARALHKFTVLGADTLLIAEDVVTTGGSVERYLRQVRNDPLIETPTRIIGVCVFARGPSCPAWVTPLFRIPAPCVQGG